MDGILDFIRESVAAEEPILVVLCAEKLDALQTDLGGDSDRVLFADMDEVGINPARIIPAWHDFLPLITRATNARCAGWASRFGLRGARRNWWSASVTRRC